VKCLPFGIFLENLFFALFLQKMGVREDFIVLFTEALMQE
jgi:hypothetical protein